MLSPANIVAFTLAVTISLVTPAALTAEGAKEAWEALATGGHIALIRHGNAPPGFGEIRPASGWTTATRNGTSTTKEAHRARG
jgi:hypothetical protein